MISYKQIFYIFQIENIKITEENNVTMEEKVSYYKLYGSIIYINFSISSSSKLDSPNKYNNPLNSSFYKIKNCFLSLNY